jgi:hypothetical protein
MDREPLMTAAVFDGPEESNGLTLYPATLATLTILEDRKNPALSGDEITMRAMSELAFVFTTDAKTLSKIPASEWESEVVAGVDKIDGERFQEVQEHVGKELEKFMASQASPAGKGKG